MALLPAFGGAGQPVALRGDRPGRWRLAPGRSIPPYPGRGSEGRTQPFVRQRRGARPFRRPRRVAGAAAPARCRFYGAIGKRQNYASGHVVRPAAARQRTGDGSWARIYGGCPMSRREYFRLHHCGFIFQGANLMPALDGASHLEMVLHGAHGCPGPRPSRKVTDMLALLGLARKANLLPEHLSGGEKQRVAIGRASSSSRAFLRRRADQRSRLGARRAVVELLRETARPRRDRGDGHARPSHTPLCRSRLSA